MNEIQEIINVIEESAYIHRSCSNNVMANRLCDALNKIKELSNNKDTEILDYEKYNNDYAFHNITCYCRKLIIDGVIDKDDLVEAAQMAARQIEIGDHEQ